MPITRKQFELEINSKTSEWMRKIHKLLAEHKDQAFSAKELYKSFTGKQLPRFPIPEDEGGGFGYSAEGYEEGVAFDTALEKLVELGTAEKRIIQGEDYYSYGPNPLEL